MVLGCINTHGCWWVPSFGVVKILKFSLYRKRSSEGKHLKHVVFFFRHSCVNANDACTLTKGYSIEWRPNSFETQCMILQIKISQKNEILSESWGLIVKVHGPSVACTRLELRACYPQLVWPSICLTKKCLHATWSIIILLTPFQKKPEICKNMVQYEYISIAQRVDGYWFQLGNQRQFFKSGCMRTRKAFRSTRKVWRGSSTAAISGLCLVVLELRSD